jgi:hypothetical protein
MNKVGSQQVGAAGELIVCADLLLRGYQVFRNVSASGVDLLAFKGESKVYRVSVKSGTASAGSDRGEWDILATPYDRSGLVVYQFRDGCKFRFAHARCGHLQWDNERGEFEAADLEGAPNA